MDTLAIAATAAIDNGGTPSGGGEEKVHRRARHLTVRYLLTFSLLAVLALANYLILRAQIETNRALDAVMADTGGQRSLVQRSALLAQKLVAATRPEERARLRSQGLAIVESLQATHEGLSRGGPGAGALPPEVQAIYSDSPWQLDARMQDYVAHMGALVAAPDRELDWGNPHLAFIEDAAMSGRIVDALDAIVAAYQRRSEQKTAYLHGLALWSFGSVFAVLVVSGLFVFHPMVRRVRQDMETLQQLSNVLERRVAERTALADRRAAELSFSEQALRDQSRLLRSILNSMGDGVIVLDGEGRFQLLNPRAREIFNVRPQGGNPDAWTEGWTRRYGLDLLLPDAEAPYPAGCFPLLRALKGERIDAAEARLRKAATPETTWLSVTARPLVDDEYAVRGSVAVVRDITAGKLAEHAVEKSESLYRSLVDHLPLYVLRKDLHGRFTFVNDSLCQLAGRTREEFIGKTDFDLYPHELARKYVRDDQDVIQRGKIFRDVEEHRAADGSLRHVEVLKTPVRGAQGEVVETQIVFLDVTDRVEAERRLVQAARLAAIGEMVAGVAHESRNALQQIQACSGLLRWRLEGDAEAGALMADLQKALDGLLRLFEDLRGYAVPVTLELRPCNVRDVLAEAWSALAASRGGRDATLHAPGCTHDVPCMADPLRLQQVFRNILENALGACEDPVVIEVEIADAAIGGSPALCLVFRDNGPGFTPEQQQRAFEPFYTTKSTGTGLGMGIAKRIIDAHRGEITLGNRPARGAEIRITLPRGEG